MMTTKVHSVVCNVISRFIISYKNKFFDCSATHGEGLDRQTSFYSLLFVQKSTDIRFEKLTTDMSITLHIFCYPRETVEITHYISSIQS